MDATEAKHQAFQSGMSKELVSAFRNAADAKTANGDLIFSRRVSRDLAKHVACRNYTRIILQLCHFVNVVDAIYKEGWETFLGREITGNRASSHFFRTLIIEREKDTGWRRGGLMSNSDGIVIKYDSAQFTVPFERMPILSIMLYFLVGTVGYKEVEKIFTEMLEDVTKEGSIGEASNGISRKLYDYLTDHLRPAQEQEKFETIVAFLNNFNNRVKLEINDEIILSFWREQINVEGSGDFKLYRSVVRAFVAFVKAMQRGSIVGSLDNCFSFGENREAGEISLDIFMATSDMESEWQSPLLKLEVDPAKRIRFLNSREQKDLLLMMDWGPLAEEWPLSLLRHETFGFTQSRLTQAARSKKDILQIRKIASCDDTENFQNRITRLKYLHEHVSETVKASTWMLRESGEFKEGMGSDEGSVVEGYFVEARRAFNRLNRHGFTDTDSEVPDLLEGHQEGLGAMLRIREKLGVWFKIIEGLEEKSPSLSDQFVSDAHFFGECFQRLYGEH